MHNETFISSLIGLLIVLVVFLICREVVCWYWKLNKIVELLEEQNKLLGSLKRSKNEKIES